MMVRAQILARSETQKVAVGAYDEAMALPKTTSGQKLDIEFNLMRLGLFWGDVPFLDKHVQASHVLVDNGGDWERRNRLKVYEATYLMCIRDFKKASVLLLESISTFTAVELYGYPKFVYYTVICATVALERKTIREKVINAPEILQVIGDDLVLESMMNSLFNCKYMEFFKSLVDCVLDRLSADRFLAPHAKYFLRQARIVAYTQVRLNSTPSPPPQKKGFLCCVCARMYTSNSAAISWVLDVARPAICPSVTVEEHRLLCQSCATLS